MLWWGKESKPMKDRVIDISLLVALGVISLIIVFALLNLGRSRGSAEGDATPPSEESVLIPEDSANDSQTNDDSVSSSPDNEQADSEAEDSANAETESAEDTATEQEETAEENEDEARVIPEGDVTLERIGFSFASGQEGACAIPLQPWEHVAVSRDLLDAYGCGTEVVVNLPETINGRDSFTAVIADTMNPSFSNTVNIYVAEDEPAFEYGILDGGTLEVAGP